MKAVVVHTPAMGIAQSTLEHSTDQWQEIRELLAGRWLMINTPLGKAWRNNTNELLNFSVPQAMGQSKTEYSTTKLDMQLWGFLAAVVPVTTPVLSFKIPWEQWSCTVPSILLEFLEAQQESKPQILTTKEVYIDVQGTAHSSLKNEKKKKEWINGWKIDTSLLPIPTISILT